MDDSNKNIKQFRGKVATLGGACMIKNAKNYIAIGDPVPYTNPGSFLGAALRGFSDIKYLPFRLQSPIKAHEFSGPSYLQAVDNFITGI